MNLTWNYKIHQYEYSPQEGLSCEESHSFILIVWRKRNLRTLKFMNLIWDGYKYKKLGLWFFDIFYGKQGYWKSLECDYIDFDDDE